MENQESDHYEVEINRFFNIFSTQNLIMMICLVTLSVASMIAYFISDKLDLKDVILLSCGCAVIMLVKLLSNPKCLLVTPETIKFRYRTALLTLLLNGKIRFGDGSESRYEKVYTLYNIRRIEYFQTPLEKIFSCGHIRICGDVTMRGERETENTFTLYGITDFDEVSAWMKSFIVLSGNQSE